MVVPGGIERHRARMAALRAAPVTDICGVPVARFVDYAGGAEGLPPADMLGIWLIDGTRVMIRPSGTEPKLKAYLQVVETWGPDAEHRADERPTAVSEAVADLLMKRASCPTSLSEP